MPRRLIAIAAMLLACVAAPAALAASGSQVVADCNTNGQLTGHYTLGQLRTALSTMPASIKEYTDCYDVIQRQLVAQLGNVSGGGGVPGGAGGSGSGSGGSGGSFLSAPVIALLAVLVAAGAGFGVVAVRRRASS